MTFHTPTQNSGWREEKPVMHLKEKLEKLKWKLIWSNAGYAMPLVPVPAIVVALVYNTNWSFQIYVLLPLDVPQS